MGQGYYNAIGFGCIRTKAMQFSDDEWEKGDEFYELVDSCGGQTGHESDPEYIAIPVIDSRDDMGGFGKTMPMSDFAMFAARKVSKSVIARWERLRKKAKAKFGMDLPAGQLLFIADYD